MSLGELVSLTRHPSERGKRRGLPLACGCSCCCCCLHAVGGVVGALIGTARAASHARGSAPVPTGKIPASKLDDRTRSVLGAFAVYWAASRAHQSGRLGGPALAGIGQTVRERAQGTWEALYPGRRPEAAAWMLDRLGLMVQEGILPLAAVEHFQRVLGPAPASAAAAGDPSRGPLALLWRLHLLYMELAAAVDVGAIPATALPPARGYLCEQGLRATAQLGGYRGTERAGAFTPEIRNEADEILAGLERGHGLAPQDRVVLDEVLAGGKPGTPAPTGGAGEGGCPICADSMAGTPIVHCAACETPHHDACWRYNGRCSTFACGSLDVAERPPPPGTPIRFDVREGSSRDAESRPWARAAFLHWLAFLVITVGYAASVREGIFVALILGPAFQLGASVLAAIAILVWPASGRWAAFGALATITWCALGGTLLGTGLMIGACVLAGS